MIIHPLEIYSNKDEIKIQSCIESANRKETLWYSVDKKYESFLTTETLDSFFLGVLPLAMILGEDIEVRGNISEKLYYNVNNYLMKLMQLLLPALKRVNIFYENLKNISDNRGNAVVTGFTGGVDSLCTIADHLQGCPSNYRLTHLFFANVGGNGVGELGETVFLKRLNILKPGAKELGLELVTINSNLGDLTCYPLISGSGKEPKGFKTENYTSAHQLRSISAILILQKFFCKYYLASGYSYTDITLEKNTTLDHIDSIIITLMSTERVECIPSGSQYSRVEKTKRLTSFEPSFRILNVCDNLNSDGKNCSCCYKCFRTMITLEILGELEKYRSVFDLEIHRKNRNKNIYLMLKVHHKSSFHSEIVSLARSIGYKFPLNLHIVAILNNAVGKPIKRLIKLFKI